MMYMPSLFGENLMDDVMNDFDDDFFHAPAAFGKYARNFMRTDVKQKDGEYELDIELPGLKKDDVKIDLENGYLNISASGNQDKEEKDKKGRLIRHERYSGSMARSFYVGDNVTEDQVHAKFEDGVLKITVPDTEQKEAVPEKKTIAIEG